MTETICNFAVIRFLPYIETGEFVNVGVVAHCPEVDFFDFRIVKPTARRVWGFFPEFAKPTFAVVMGLLENELKRHRNPSGLYGEAAAHRDSYIAERMAAFDALTRRRESLLHFGEVRTKVLREAPADAMDRLFDNLVNRKFARAPKYHETVMNERVKSWLREWRLTRLYKKADVGDAEFCIQLPFVHQIGTRPVHAIKPFDLKKGNTTDIYLHGGAWVDKMRRLRARGRQPEKMVFSIELPQEENLRRVADEIRSELEAMNVITIEFEDREALRQAAEIKHAEF